MLWKLLVIALLVTAAVAIAVEHAVTSSDVRTIAYVKAVDAEGGTVTIHGIITYANENKFAVKDESGEAELITCPTWYKRISLFPGDEVTVIGQVLKSHPTISKAELALSVYKIFRNGETIEVRDKPGKPPWATGTNP